MTPQDQINQLNNDLQKANKRIADLERISIQAVIDPTTFLYLESAVNSIVGDMPTSTYSTSAPSGTAITGSTWYEDTGVLATRKIHVYSGSAWVQFK